MKMIFLILIIATLNFFYLSEPTVANENMDKYFRSSGSDHRGGQVSNFGSPGLIDLPSGYRLPDGEIIVQQRFQKTLLRSTLSSQITPRLNLSFSYSSQGPKKPLGTFSGSDVHKYLTGRINHDRSFHAHFNLWREGNYYPSVAFGLRDFVGTGWYSSEYIVASKTFGDFQTSLGLGFGRLAGKNTIGNPLKFINSKFKKRGGNNVGVGGTLSSYKNWFSGDAGLFGGVTYKPNERLSFTAEHTSDPMKYESNYIDFKSSWNLGANYKYSDILTLSGQYLYGSEFALTANIFLNPNRPPNNAGLELAPVPMRHRNTKPSSYKISDQETIYKVLKVDGFKIKNYQQSENLVRIDVINTKFRSVAQAVGRIVSTLQRFTSDDIKEAVIVFHRNNLQLISYKVRFEDIDSEQFGVFDSKISAKNFSALNTKKFAYGVDNRFQWGLGPYFEHRLFNPDMLVTLETGIEFAGRLKVIPNFYLEGSTRKSLLTNLTNNNRLDSFSVLPRVHSDWGYYDIHGQKGHIPNLKFSYMENIAPAFYGRAQFGFLEPFFAGLGGEILFKPASSPFALGLDIHRVKQRDYDMLFDLRPYETTVGHVSIYYDAGGMFDVEVNAGRYLAKDWGVTTTISRQFSNGWEVGGHATFTDVPFEKFGEGSFDKGVYVTIPIDWIIGSPDQSRRGFFIRPITRDGGARLASGRSLYKTIKGVQKAQFTREYGRLWK